VPEGGKGENLQKSTASRSKSDNQADAFHLASDDQMPSAASSTRSTPKFTKFDSLEPDNSDTFVSSPHLGLREGPKRATLSYANAKRPWELFERLFYDQLSLAQRVAPKKKLRFKNKLLSMDASVIDLSLACKPEGGVSDIGGPPCATIELTRR
jgi:hypothetical protein